jgi:hypothetical protein
VRTCAPAEKGARRSDLPKQSGFWKSFLNPNWRQQTRSDQTIGCFVLHYRGRLVYSSQSQRFPYQSVTLILRFYIVGWLLSVLAPRPVSLRVSLTSNSTVNHFNNISFITREGYHFMVMDVSFDLFGPRVNPKFI